MQGSLHFSRYFKRLDDEFPSLLKPYLSESKERLKSEAIPTIVALVKDHAWSDSRRDESRGAGKEFGPFLRNLAEVL